MLKKTVLLGEPYIKTMLTVTADESATISCSNRFFSPIYISESDKVLTDYVVDETDVRLEFGEEFTVTGTVYVYHTNFNSLDAIGSINYVETTGGRGFVGAGGSGGGSTDFTGLTDTPTGYTGHGGKAVTVKTDESGLEFGIFSNTNIYTDDGSLAGDRLISCSTHSLTLESGDNSFIIDNLLVAMKGDTGELSISSVGAITLDAPAGIRVNGTVGVAGQILVSNGVGATPTWNTVNTASLYNADGTLTENRTFHLAGNALSFNNNNSTYLSQNESAIQISGVGGIGVEAYVKASATGRLDIECTSGLFINNSLGTSGQVLTSRGNATPEWSDIPTGGDSIYTADGSLSGNRIVGLGGNELLIGESWCGLTLDGQIVRLRTNDTGEAIVECNQDGQVRLKADNGLLLDTSTGSVGQVLTSGGANASPTWETPSGGSVDTLYTANGTLVGDRLVTCDSHELKFGQTDSFIRLQTTEARLNANGGVGLTADISVNTSGQMIVIADKGLSVDGSYGTAGQVLTSNGVDATPTWSDTANIYNSNGTLSSNRTINLFGNSLTIRQSSNYYTHMSNEGFRAVADTEIFTVIDTGISLQTTHGLSLNGAVGTSGQVLTSQGSGSAPTWTTISGGSGNTIYSADDTLTGDRTILCDTHTLTIRKTVNGGDWNQRIMMDTDYTEIYNADGNMGVESYIRTYNSGTMSLTASAGLSLNSTVGTSGQVLTSQGAGQPIWTTISGGASTLVDLTDTNINSPADGQALIWDNTNSEWVNGTVSGSGDMLKSVYDTNDSGVVDNAEKVNNLTVETAVPSGAVFTDTTYNNATTAVDGLMSASDKTKLDGVEDNANNYIHPANHSPDIISETSDKQFVSSTNKSTWDNKLSDVVAGTNITIDKTDPLNPIIASTASGGSGHTIQDEGTSLTDRTNLDFVGELVTVTDDSGNDKTIVTVVHPTTSGNKHIPSGGSSGQVLIWDSDGTAVWGTSSGGDTTMYGTSNPSLTTNPATKDVIYVNTTTGQAFLCTDNTTDANIWEGQLGTKLYPLLSPLSSDIFNDGSTVARYKGDNDATEIDGRTADLTTVDVSYFTGKHDDAFNLIGTSARLDTPSLSFSSASLWFYIDSNISNGVDRWYLIDFNHTSNGYAYISSNDEIMLSKCSAYIDNTAVNSGDKLSNYKDGWHHLYIEPNSSISNCVVRIANKYNDETSGYQSDGIDTPTFFNRTLTTSEIEQLYIESTTSGSLHVEETGVRLNEIQTFSKPQCTSIDDTATTNIIPFDEANNHHFTATADDVTFTGGTVGQQGMIVIDSADNITGWDTKFKFKNTLGALTGTETFSYFIQDLNTIRIMRWE